MLPCVVRPQRHLTPKTASFLLWSILFLKKIIFWQKKWRGQGYDPYTIIRTNIISYFFWESYYWSIVSMTSCNVFWNYKKHQRLTYTVHSTYSRWTHLVCHIYSDTPISETCVRKNTRVLCDKRYCYLWCKSLALIVEIYY